MLIFRKKNLTELKVDCKLVRSESVNSSESDGQFGFCRKLNQFLEKKAVYSQSAYLFLLLFLKSQFLFFLYTHRLIKFNFLHTYVQI